MRRERNRRALVWTGSAQERTCSRHWRRRRLPACAQDGRRSPAAGRRRPLPKSRRADDRQDDATRDRVYVLGRRVVSSVATIDVEDAPQVVNIIDGETLQEQGVASLEQALRNVPGITTQIGEGGVMSGDQFFIRGLTRQERHLHRRPARFRRLHPRLVQLRPGRSVQGPVGLRLRPRRCRRRHQHDVQDARRPTRIGGSSSPCGDGRLSARHRRLEPAARRRHGGAHRRDGRTRTATPAAIRSTRSAGASRRRSRFGLDSPTTVTIAYLHQDEEKLPDYGIPTHHRRARHTRPGV